MLKWLFKIFFKAHGWKLHQPTPKEANHCIMIAAPHTSNWDFIYAISALDQLKVNPRFTIKKEFNFFPLGGLISSLGAIWIDRSPKDGQKKSRSMTEVMTELFEKTTGPLAVVVTPEGTRSKAKQWKTGFYYAALAAKAPICLAFMDYKTKITGVGVCFMPTGDIQADMAFIMDFYRDKTAKFPAGFGLDERFG